MTPRERNVLLLVGRRLTNEEIAHELWLSKRTVEAYVSSIYAKLGGTSRRDLVAQADLLRATNPAPASQAPDGTFRDTARHQRHVITMHNDKIEVEHTEAECVVKLVGEIDLAVAPDVARIADELLAECPDNAPIVVIDLTDVTFLDSSGMGMLVALQKHALERGQQAALRGLSDRIARPLESTGLIDLFTIA